MWPPSFVSIMLNSENVIWQSRLHCMCQHLTTILTVIPVVNFTNPLLNDWLYLFRGELLLGDTTVIIGVDP